MINNPPYTNGVMELEQVDVDLIEADLLQLKASFVPTDEEPELTIHSLVSRYNALNPTEPINGDTAEFVLSQIEEIGE